MNLKDYCSYELSKSLMECGFNEPCLAKWACYPGENPYMVCSTAFLFKNWELVGNDVAAPLLYQAQKWLREKGYEVTASYTGYLDHFGYDWNVIQLVDNDSIDCNQGDVYKTYEEALAAGIADVCKLIKSQEIKIEA